MTRRGVIFDLVAAQSPSYRGRGIARYSTDLVRAIVRYHPELVNSIAVHPDLGPVDELSDLSQWLTAEPDWSEASVLHLSSVFEPEVPVRRFWPREASANRLLTAVTVYDLIPDIFPDWYLMDPGLRRRWRCCREVARSADMVMTLSESARSDTVRMLGVPAGRVHVIGSGCSDVFRPPASPELAWKAASRQIKGLKPGFIIYNGAFNPRKNVDGLIRAYAALPMRLIEEHQLLVVCHAAPLERNHYLVMADRMGLRGRILVPGYVSDEALVALYQCTELNVFPSLYEGFGLPVVEAMACGAPTIAGNNSSLVEILPRYALFDASDPAAISEAMAKALTEPSFRQRLCTLTEHDPPSWHDVADRAAAVFESMMQRAERWRPAWRTKPQVALVGAPEALAQALGRWATVERFGVPHGSQDGHNVLAYATLRRLDAWRGGYDAIVGWCDGSGRAARRVAKTLGRQWPRRAVVVLAPEAGDQAAIAEDLGRAGCAVVPKHEDESWEVTAGQLARGLKGFGGQPAASGRSSPAPSDGSAPPPGGAAG